MNGKNLTGIGRAEKINFPELGLVAVPARIDTGARTSSIWASGITESDGQLSFCLFDKASKKYTGEVIKVTHYTQRVVSSSIGVEENRYVVKILVEVKDRKIRASFTLADRSQQVYPVLVGRNILRGKFIVDVRQGEPLAAEERQRNRELQRKLNRSKDK